MKLRRRLIALGIVTPVFLAFCGFFALLILGGVGYWLFSGEESPQRLLRVATVAPLSTPATATPVPPQAQAQGQPTATNTPIVIGMDMTPTPTLIPTPDPAVEAALGFALPAGSVNSVRNEGIADRVLIPRLGLDAPIVLAPIRDQTWDVEDLGQTVGHLEGTAPPGSGSNFVLAGHVTLSENVYGPFANLSSLIPGDIITVYENGQAYQYVVESQQIVDRTAVNVTYPTNRGEITLITCNNWDSTEGRYIERIVVKGTLITN